ncbi:hypothetical protein AMTR_s00013p00095490 [Amborella trichopoda]|uniref:Uncharacterized protein n=1 Tax=Amborella trichopoda TaxID=13333 RepID=W1PQ69_AMBTC|nr:hypothetical protein AMTR_s00013p00095490 [Amborella trichopoda]
MSNTLNCSKFINASKFRFFGSRRITWFSVFPKTLSHFAEIQSKCQSSALQTKRQAISSRPFAHIEILTVKPRLAGQAIFCLTGTKLQTRRAWIPNV